MKLITIFVLFLSILLSHCGNKITSEEQIKIEKQISNMVSKYNAITDWEDSLAAHSPIFSIDLQNKMVNTNGRPILISANLIDISQKDNEYLLYFNYPDYLNDNINLILKCDNDIAKKLNLVVEKMDFVEKLMNEFMIIAKISEVKRIGFAVIIEEHDSYNSIELGQSSFPTFIVNGRLIDFVKK